MIKIGKKKYLCKIYLCSDYLWFKKKPIQSIGIVEGKISKKKIGKNGFGYDPIFIPNRKKLTFGQMNYSEKLKIDHRMKAFSKIKKIFLNLLFSTE